MEPSHPTRQTAPLRPWKVLIVDGDGGLRRAAGPALAPLHHDGRGLELLAARSLTEARAVMQAHPDLAVLVLDVLMEGRDAGLRLVELARQKSAGLLRIVLWIGQPEHLSERAAMESCDADGCLMAAAGLTEDALYLAVLRSLRIHAGFAAQEGNRRAMSRVMVATSGLFELRSSHHFHFNCLLQLNSLLEMGPNALLCVRGDGIPRDELIRIRAGTGRFAALRNVLLDDFGDPAIRAVIEEAFRHGKAQTSRHFAVSMHSRVDTTVVAFIEGSRELTPLDVQMLEIFRGKASTALGSILLVNELNAVRKAIVLTLARVAEYKDNVSPGHLQRIERLTEETGRELYRRGAYAAELDETLLDQLGLASILHDVGMICVPDKIMYSTEQLLAEDFRTIRNHPQAGWDILQGAAGVLRGRSVLAIAADIARSHHECFDGSGYPAGLAGQDIPLAGRIVALADVFDALITDRSHRHAWSVAEALDWIKAQSGRHFDPVVTDAFLVVVERIRKAEPDWLPVPETPAAAAEAAALEARPPGLGDGLRRWVGRFSSGGRKGPDA